MDAIKVFCFVFALVGVFAAVIRTCSLIKVGKNECKEGTQLGLKIKACACVKDLCNGTMRVTVTIFTLVTAVLAAFKLM
ncbi:hypothetical protein MAR_035918 [Mya arenaria]|uniref:Uncharacterized protein n=1 Tax=Mya arenaria TaxID=6604 RepID=A0ABY7EPG3_MYAAR|nr:hypothetical protein MAR_035918 [Mya arenaria]